MSRAALATLPWPLATIDFEASSLEWDGYPIEVGIAVWHDADAPILGWSTLIRPPLAWREGGHWSRASAKVHGITMSDLLADGLPVDETVRRLTALLAPFATAWCDGGPYDDVWLRSLFQAAGLEPAFVLRDWADLLSGLDEAGHERARLQLATAPRHRAREDAERLILAAAVGLDIARPQWGILSEP